MRRTFVVLGLLVPVVACAEPEPESCMPLLSIEATPPLLMSGDMLRLTVDLRGATLVPPGDDPGDELGENCAGHYKVHLDSAESAALQSSSEEELVFPIEAEPGEHELIVRMYDPNDVPFIPDVSETATLTFQ